MSSIEGFMRKSYKVKDVVELLIKLDKKYARDPHITRPIIQKFIPLMQDDPVEAPLIKTDLDRSYREAAKLLCESIARLSSSTAQKDTV